MRRKILHKDEHEEEIWHIVYLDFVTTMMILFMAMWAANQVAAKKGRDANVRTGGRDFDGKTFASGQTNLLPEFENDISKWNDDHKGTVFGELGKKDDDSRLVLIINGHASKDDVPDMLSNHKKNMEISVLRALNVYRHTVEDLSRKVPDKEKLDIMLSNISVCGHSFNDPVVKPENLTLLQNKPAELKAEMAKNQRITFQVNQSFMETQDD